MCADRGVTSPGSGSCKLAEDLGPRNAFYRIQTGAKSEPIKSGYPLQKAGFHRAIRSLLYPRYGPAAAPKKASHQPLPAHGVPTRGLFYLAADAISASLPTSLQATASDTDSATRILGPCSWRILVTCPTSTQVNQAPRTSGHACCWLVTIALTMALSFSLLVLIPRIVYGANLSENEQSRSPADDSGRQRIQHARVDSQSTALARPAKRQFSIRLLSQSVRRNNAGLECRIGAQDVLITNPWSGKIERFSFTKLRISVDHPQVGNTDPARNGLKTPLAIRARGPVEIGGNPSWCIVYSALIEPERVAPAVWSKVDRLLAALVALGATIEQRRPPQDRSEFDEDSLQSYQAHAPYREALSD